MRWADCFPAKNGAHRGDNVGRASILQQIASNTGANGSYEFLFARFHANQDYLTSGRTGIICRENCRQPAGEEGIAHQNVALRRKGTLGSLVRWRTLPHDNQIGARAEESNKSFAQEPIFNQQKYTYRRYGDIISHNRPDLTGREHLK